MTTNPNPQQEFEPVLSEKASGCDNDPEEDFEDETQDMLPRKESKSTAFYTFSSCWSFLVILVALVLGFVAGQILPTVAFLDGIRNNYNYNYNDNYCNDDPVSYNFLKTTRGKDVFEELNTDLHNEGPQAALLTLQHYMERDDQIAASCHPLAHMLGRMAWMYLGFEGAFDQLLGTEKDIIFRLCNGAYMHGIIEHYLAAADTASSTSSPSSEELSSLPTTNSSLVEEAVEFVQKNLCLKLTKLVTTRLDNQWECEHGVGHGIAQFVRIQKERETVRDGLAMCAKSSSTTRTCQNGLWMDYFASTRVTDTVLDPSSLHVCIDNKEASASVFDCVFYSPTSYLLHNPEDYRGAIHFCLEAFPPSSSTDNRNYANNCIRGVGSQAAKEHMRNYAPVEAVCKTAPDIQMKAQCMGGAFSYYMTANGVNTIPEELCTNLHYFKEECMKHVFGP